MKNFSKRAGISILGLLVLGFIAILVLSYFGVNIKSVVNSPTGQENLNYVGGGAETVWTKYFAGPAEYLWKDVWVNIFWQSFIDNMKRIRDGQPTNIDNAANNLKVQVQ